MRACAFPASSISIAPGRSPCRPDHVEKGALRVGWNLSLFEIVGQLCRRLGSIHEDQIETPVAHDIIPCVKMVIAFTRPVPAAGQ